MGQCTTAQNELGLPKDITSVINSINIKPEIEKLKLHNKLNNKHKWSLKLKHKKMNKKVNKKKRKSSKSHSELKIKIQYSIKYSDKNDDNDEMLSSDSTSNSIDNNNNNNNDTNNKQNMDITLDDFPSQLTYAISNTQKEGDNDIKYDELSYYKSNNPNENGGETDRELSYITNVTNVTYVSEHINDDNCNDSESNDIITNIDNNHLDSIMYNNNENNAETLMGQCNGEQQIKFKYD